MIIGIIISFTGTQFMSHTLPQLSPRPPTVVPPMTPFQQV
jgi:hypothetical protein